MSAAAPILGALATLAAATPALGGAPGELVVRGREPLPVVVLAQSAFATLSGSELLAGLGRRVEEDTNLAVRVVDSNAAAGCAGELSCIVLELGGEREASAGARWIVVLSRLGREGDTDRLSVTLVDLRAALREWEAAPRDEADWRAAVEAAVNERAVAVSTPFTEVRDRAEAERWLDGLVAERLRPVFEAAGAWRPWGGIELRGAGAGFVVEVDGVTIGTTGADPTRLVLVPPGRRAVVLTHPEHAPVRAEVVVEAGRLVPLVVEPELLAGATHALRDVTTWSGVGLAAAGAVTLAVALVRADGDVVTYCLGAGDGAVVAGCDPSSQFQRAGYDPGATPGFSGALNPPGVRLAPLGYSLVLTGVIWSLGAVLLGDTREAPWIPLVAGVILGAATYGLSVALDGQSAFDARP